jgi:hypothetical protein
MAGVIVPACAQADCDPATEQNVQNKMTAGPKQRIFSISRRRFK